MERPVPAATMALPPRSVMIRASRRRSPAFEGVFVTAVKSTGIVCRPTCPAGPALAKNLTFYPRLSDALAAGYRPCKRCKPEVAVPEHAWVEGLLERARRKVPPRARRTSRAATGRLYAARITTPLGAMLGVATAEGLVLLEFADRPMLRAQLAALGRHFDATVVAGPHVHLRRVQRELTEWFAGRRRDFTTPLLIRGTPFQEAAWRALTKIPAGSTRSYQAQARAIGRPGAIRAAGTANGDNRLAIVIPCHRVVRSDGSLGGYGGGLWRKAELLRLERCGR